MRLKSFHAQSVTEAMKMIRESLGEDAIIVSTVEDPMGGVSVTAAVDSPVSGQHFFNYDRDMAEGDEDNWLQYDVEQDVGAVAEDLTDTLLKHAVPEEIIDQIVSCAGVVGLEQSRIALIAALEHLFVYRPLAQMPSDRPIILVGPPGAGKTLAAAKIAARAALSGRKPSVISTDTLRAGGTEQLAAFTRIMNVQLYKAKTGTELRTLIDTARSADQIIIDTAGLNPFRQDDMRALARLVSVADMEPILVLPSGCDAEECGEMARIYATLGVRHLMPTRLDIGRRLGSLLSAAYHGGMIFTDASDTPQVADGLLPLSPDRLANLLMPQSTTSAAATSYADSPSSGFSIRDDDAPFNTKRPVPAG